MKGPYNEFVGFVIRKLLCQIGEKSGQRIDRLFAVGDGPSAHRDRALAPQSLRCGRRFKYNAGNVAIAGTGISSRLAQVFEQIGRHALNCIERPSVHLRNPLCSAASRHSESRYGANTALRYSVLLEKKSVISNSARARITARRAVHPDAYGGNRAMASKSPRS